MNGQQVKIFYYSIEEEEADTFHNRCNNKGPTIFLFKNEKGYFFGGNEFINWASNDNIRSAPHCFIFSLTNKY